MTTPNRSRTHAAIAANPAGATLVGPVRTRRARAVEGSTAKEINPELTRLAAVHYSANKKANKAAAESEAARKDLYKGMKAEGIHDFRFRTNIDGSELVLEAALATPTSTVIDVQALRKIVSEEQFMQIISATKTAVEKFAGTEAVTRCGSVKNGTENVSVKPAK